MDVVYSLWVINNLLTASRYLVMQSPEIASPTWGGKTEMNFVDRKNNTFRGNHGVLTQDIPLSNLRGQGKTRQSPWLSAQGGYLVVFCNSPITAQTSYGIRNAAEWPQAHPMLVKVVRGKTLLYKPRIKYLQFNLGLLITVFIFNEPPAVAVNNVLILTLAHRLTVTLLPMTLIRLGSQSTFRLVIRYHGCFNVHDISTMANPLT